MGKDQELIDAARNGDYQIVDKILTQRAKRSGPLASLRRGAGVNVQDSSGYSALHHAAVNRHKVIVELLLSHEASINIVDLQGSSPLHLAAWSGNEDIVHLLLTNVPSSPNVNLMNQSLETALHMAAQFGHVGVVKLLLEYGAYPTITNSRQETCLDLAARYGRLETVQLLVNSHPELLSSYSCHSFSRKVFLHTPLHLASRNGHRSVVEILVNAGFDVNIRTSDGTALHEAALCGKVDVVKVLLDAGIDVCVTDSFRRTAVDRLSEVGLKTPVAKEIADLIRGALKKSICRSNWEKSSTSSSPQVTGSNDDDKLPLNQIYDNHSDIESPSGSNSAKTRYTSSPLLSPKTNFSRDKTRRSLDVYLSKGPDFDKPPKKPPRRNLSASPTHPDFSCSGSSESNEIGSSQLLARNKSLDESVYGCGDGWRNSIGSGRLETSHSTELLDISFMSSKKLMYRLQGNFNSQSPNEISLPASLPLDSKEMTILTESNICGKSIIPLSTSPTCPDTHYQSPFKARLKESTKEIEDATTRLLIDTANILQDRPKPPQKPVPRPKPIIAPKPTILPKPQIAPKPKNIKRQGHSCDKVLDGSRPFSSPGIERESSSSSSRNPKIKSTSMSGLSPTDFEKEWNGITSLMSSFITTKNDLDVDGRLLRSFIICGDVGKWLATHDMLTYESLLLANGFDDIEFLGGGILDENSLLEIGMLNAQHRKVLGDACYKLDVSWPESLNKYGVPHSVGKWLKELHLEQYLLTFETNFYSDPERLLRLWNEELITVLEIEPLGHRRRLLMAAAKATGCKLNHPGNGQCSTKEMEPIGSSSSSLPLREPNVLVSGVSSALKTAWRHSPETLINGSVTYRAVYVGTCFVQEFSTTESIQRAICEIRAHELRKIISGSSGPEAGKSPARTNVYNTNAMLIISATVISWYNSKTKSLISEHEVGTIQCTCQASDDLRHLALVTKDPNSSSHSCHVFCLDSVEIATEAILTLGQAFEVAYQLALSVREETKDARRHVRSKSVNQLSTNLLIPDVGPSQNVLGENERIPTNNSSNKHHHHHHHHHHHSRSYSVTELPPPPPIPPISSFPTSSSTIITKSNHIKDTTKLPRAESFSYTPSKSSHQFLSRAPIVSKEEL